jgi:putative sterol carrier protein
MLDYLSDEWFKQADMALQNVPALSEHVTVAVRITGDGRVPDIAYRLILGPGQVRMINDAEPGDVRLTMPYPISVAIARGEIGAQRAFLDGEIQLGGDTTALLGHQSQLADIDDQLAELRSRTNY